MKKWGLYLMLVIYLSAQLRPVTTIVLDVFAHVFWEAHHLATEHHEHNHNHLHDELKDIEDDHHDHEHTSSENIPGKNNSKEDLFNHLLPSCGFQFKIAVVNSTYSKARDKKLAFTFKEITTPPPQA